jgi:hypothetical protein
MVEALRSMHGMQNISIITISNQEAKNPCLCGGLRPSLRKRALEAYFWANGPRPISCCKTSEMVTISHLRKNVLYGGFCGGLRNISCPIRYIRFI